MKRIVLGVEYDGSAYSGWQWQRNRRSVQAMLEQALSKVANQPIMVICAGRTDAGVHAIGQVANFHTDCRIPIENVRRGLQSFLPEDITVATVREVAPAFHSTYSAIRKRYRYAICDSDVCAPFLNRFVYRCRFHLDVEKMAEAVGHLLGTHDFRCFETQFPNKSTSVRTIMEASIGRIPGWNVWDARHSWIPSFGRPYQHAQQPIIVFEVMADGFLYNMVRAIVGTLTEIGRGKNRPEFLAEVIQSMDRTQAGITSPANGLYLVHVDYPDELMQSPEFSA